jgi:sugar/nucleoside kinase (ribokinase family)
MSWKLKGAGDAFVGAFAHYLSRLGVDSINKAIQLACDYATLTVQALGTQASYPFVDKIDSKFKV